MDVVAHDLRLAHARQARRAGAQQVRRDQLRERGLGHLPGREAVALDSRCILFEDQRHVAAMPPDIDVAIAEVAVHRRLPLPPHSERLSASA